MRWWNFLRTSEQEYELREGCSKALAGNYRRCTVHPVLLRRIKFVAPRYGIPVCLELPQSRKWNLLSKYILIRGRAEFGGRRAPATVRLFGSKGQGARITIACGGVIWRWSGKWKNANRRHGAILQRGTSVLQV